MGGGYEWFWLSVIIFLSLLDGDKFYLVSWRVGVRRGRYRFRVMYVRRGFCIRIFFILGI